MAGVGNPFKPEHPQPILPTASERLDGETDAGLFSDLMA
jgi:hypothetical protein